MSEPFIETSLETLTLTGQRQPSMRRESSGDDLDKILAGVPLDLESANDGTSASWHPNSNEEPFDINALIDLAVDQFDPSVLLETQLSGISIDNNSFEDFLETIKKEEPQEREQLPPPQHSIFTEHYDPINFYPSPPIQYSPSGVAVGSSPVEPKTESSLLHTYAILNQQEAIHRAAKKSKKSKNYQQHQSTNVGPVEYNIIHSGGCEPCTTGQMQTDYAYQEQLLEYDAADSKQIQILCQPRSQYRPRTQNESRISSHYLRCAEGVKPGYPTISIPKSWLFGTDMNLIEVALMGVDQQPHPYTLYNRTSSETLEDNVLIFKQGDPSVLYFRVTNEDFQNEAKTFMIELIKGKQDEVITKELIRNRQLEHSMLRFTRIFQVGKGNFQRDDGSAVYSSVMSEAYGDVEVERIGPQYGPMGGQEMVFVVLKGRVAKTDLKFEITESCTGWSYSIENFTKNGNVVYFLMPAFPYTLQCESVRANIIVHHKGEELSQSPYLYKGSLDQALAELRIGDPNTATASSSTSNNFDLFNFLSATDACPNPTSRRGSVPKSTKRLGYKSKK